MTILISVHPIPNDRFVCECGQFFMYKRVADVHLIKLCVQLHCIKWEHVQYGNVGVHKNQMK